MVRFAIIQDYVGLDGRSKTLALAIRNLNRHGVVPDIFTFSELGEADGLQLFGGDKIAFHVVRLPTPRIQLGHIFAQMRLPSLVRAHLPRYDVVFASDTSVYGYPPATNLIRLVCFPLEQVPRYEERYRRLPYRPWGAAMHILQSFARRGNSYHGVWIANSFFTRDVMLKTYPLQPDQINVLYTPVMQCEISDSGPRQRTVLTLGRFHPDKRQLEQIELARRIPDARFYIAGSVRGSSYFKRCQAAAAQLENVELLPDVSSTTLDDLFGRAKVFLHTKRFEHFGLGIAEAVSHGCVPVIHDSGGQPEIVPVEALRFQNSEGAERILRDALDGRFDAELDGLQRHVRTFNEEEFDRQFDELLAPSLS